MLPRFECPETPESMPNSPLQLVSARAWGRRALSRSPLSGRVDSPALQSQLNLAGVARTSNISNVANVLVPATAKQQCPAGTGHTQSQRHMVQIAMTGSKRPLENDTHTSEAAALPHSAKGSNLGPLPEVQPVCGNASAPFTHRIHESSTVRWCRPASVQKLAKNHSWAGT